MLLAVGSVVSGALGVIVGGAWLAWTSHGAADPGESTVVAQSNKHSRPLCRREVAAEIGVPADTDADDVAATIDTAKAHIRQALPTARNGPHLEPGIYRDDTAQPGRPLPHKRSRRAATRRLLTGAIRLRPRPHAARHGAEHAAAEAERVT